ncbi:prepilin-type N-terminal cleavage/methylation domain-containing protein [Thermodesulfobacteriota bacterium]
MRVSCSNGFTLLEVVISLGLIAIALLSVFHLQASNLELQSEAKFITVASQLIRDRVSQIRSSPTAFEGPFSGDFGDRFPEFQYSGEITSVPEKGLYKVSVKVMAGAGESVKSLTSETYLYRTQR